MGFRRLSLPLILITSALASAGCLGGDIAEPAAQEDPLVTPDASAEAGMDHAAHAQAEGASLPAPTSAALTSLHTMQLYYTADMALTDVVPAEGSVTFPQTFKNCFVTPPCGYLGFESAPMDEPWALIPGPITFDIWVVADVPVLSTGLFDFGAWFGSNVDVSASEVVVHGHILPGKPVRITWEAQHPETPNVIFPGDAFASLLVAGMTQDVGQPLRMLTGGETPSGIRFTMARVDPAALVLGEATTESAEGSLEGPAFPVTMVTGHTDRTVAVHAVTVPAEANLLRIDVTGTSPVGMPDIDIDLYDGGTPVGEGHTPRATETIQLAGPALDGLRGKTLELRVVLFYGQHADYTVTITHR